MPGAETHRSHLRKPGLVPGFLLPEEKFRARTSDANASGVFRRHGGGDNLHRDPRANGLPQMTRVPLFVLLLAMTTLAACRRESPTPASNAPSAATTRAAPAAAATAVVPLKDVVETTPRYVIGITIRRKPRRTRAWSSALMAYAANSRKDLIGAVEALGNDTPTAPYELSLSYTTLVDSPTLVAIAADGSLLHRRRAWLAADRALRVAAAAGRDADRRRARPRCEGLAGDFRFRARATAHRAVATHRRRRRAAPKNAPTC